MALARVKTWSSGEVLLASDLNSEFNNILTNARDLVSPLTNSLDMDAKELIMDGDADSSLQASTDDKLDLKLSGTILFVWDGTVALPVNGITWTAAAAGSGPTVAATGSDTNIPVTLKGKGTGHVILGQATSTDVRLAADQPIADSSGNEYVKFSKTASAINEVTLTNAAIGNGPSITATGGDTNIPITLAGKGTGHVLLGQATSTDVRLVADQPIADSSGNELVKFGKTASAINEVTLTNAAIGTPPIISATGGDTNIALALRGKGSGNVTLQDATDATKQASFVLTGVGASQNRTITMPDANVDLQYARAASDTIAGGIEIATQAEQETGTDTGRAVTPGRQHFHASASKAWGRVATPTTVDASYPAAGVSVTANAAGDYTVTFGVTLSTANAAVVVTYFSAAGTALTTMISAQTTTTFRVLFKDATPALAAPDAFMYIIMGDL